MTKEPSARQTDDLVLLPNEAMRARARPRAVLALWAFEAIAALAIAWPFASTAAGLYGSHPDGDGALWSPGGLDLMALGVRAATAGYSLAAHVAIGFAIATAASVWISAAVLTSIAYTTRDLRPPSLRRALAAAVGAFAPSALVVVTLGLVQLLIFGGGWLLADGTENALYFGSGEARAEQAQWAVLAVAGLFVCLVGIVQEIARAAVVRFRMHAGPAMIHALRVVRRAPLRLFWSWAWRAAAGLVPLAFGALVAQRIGGREGGVLVALLVVHQASTLARVTLRASWLARTMRAVDAIPRDA